MNQDFATREPALAALAGDGTATAVKQADLRARFLRMGEPVIYVPFCPASHYGGPRAYVKRPEGDETQFVIVEVENR